MMISTVSASATLPASQPTAAAQAPAAASANCCRTTAEDSVTISPCAQLAQEMKAQERNFGKA
jgi:hypothetical protein